MIWMDLDGVLVQANRAMCQALSTPYPTDTVFHRGWIKDQFPGRTLSSLFDQCHTNPDFWSNMEPSRLAGCMVSFLDEVAPDWGILTSARRHPYCYAGKHEWVRKNLGRDYLGKLVIVSGEKERLAQPTHHLTDDFQDNVLHWRAAGGKAFHWVDYSDDLMKLQDDQLAAWKQEITQHQQSH